MRDTRGTRFLHELEDQKTISISDIFVTVGFPVALTVFLVSLMGVVDAIVNNTEKKA